MASKRNTDIVECNRSSFSSERDFASRKICLQKDFEIDSCKRKVSGGLRKSRITRKSRSCKSKATKSTTAGRKGKTRRSITKYPRSSSHSSNEDQLERKTVTWEDQKERKKSDRSRSPVRPSTESLKDRKMRSKLSAALKRKSKTIKYKVKAKSKVKDPNDFYSKFLQKYAASVSGLSSTEKFEFAAKNLGKITSKKMTSLDIVKQINKSKKRKFLLSSSKQPKKVMKGNRADSDQGEKSIHSLPCGEAGKWKKIRMYQERARKREEEESRKRGRKQSKGRKSSRKRRKSRSKRKSKRRSRRKSKSRSKSRKRSKSRRKSTKRRKSAGRRKSGGRRKSRSKRRKSSRR